MRDYNYGKDNYNINLHLNGHLKDCIIDFGRVYSFGLFTFERLNGMLGSYHTNSHDISLQLMRRFIGSQNVRYHNWPEEYKPQFLPLIKGQEYQAGSLQPSSFEQALEACTSRDIKALPPVVELSWNDIQKQEIRKLITSEIGHESYDSLTLHNRAPALNVGGFVVGSSLSRYTTKTHVMAFNPDHPSDIHLAKIEHFCMLNFRVHRTCTIANSLLTSTVSRWVAYVSFYEVHPC